MSIFNKKVQRTNKFESMEFPSDVEKRDAEEHLLKPASIEPYTGELPKHSSELESRTALIVFRDKQQMDLIGKLFNIRESCAGKGYITNIELLEHFAKEVISGNMYVHNNAVHLTERNNDNARDDSEEDA